MSNQLIRILSHVYCFRLSCSTRVPQNDGFRQKSRMQHSSFENAALQLRELCNISRSHFWNSDRTRMKRGVWRFKELTFSETFVFRNDRSLTARCLPAEIALVRYTFGYYCQGDTVSVLRWLLMNWQIRQVFSTCFRLHYIVNWIILACC